SGALRKRIASLLPYIGVSALWIGTRHAADYGVVGLGGYVDPLEAPLAFLRMLPERALVLLASQVARLQADLFDWVPLNVRPWLLVAALACCGAISWLAWPSLRSSRHARFWASGAVLSILPITA